MCTDSEEKKTRKPRRPGRVIKEILIGIILCAAFGTGCFFLGRSDAGKKGATQVSAVVLQNRLADISELASVSYSYTNMAQFENSNDFYGMKVPFTTKSFMLTYDGVIKAGIDLKQASVDVQGTKVSVKLPEAKILSHEIREDSVRIFDEKTSIFNPFTVEDFTAFQNDQKKTMEKKATERGLLTEAKKKALSSAKLMLQSALPKDSSLKVE